MDEFYKKFEDRFRGARSLIMKRLSYYLPMIDVMQQSVGALSVVDLGCGRGEWLQLLTEKGHNALGVDINEAMLSDAESMGLKVKQSDVLQFLTTQASESFDVVSSFHLIEHVPFHYLQDLLKECYRVLKPGGILILETPNSENLVVGTSSFYLDPTHKTPLPAQLTSFLTLFCGFERSNIQFLNSGVENLEKQKPSLSKVINGVGLDYTVIAQKNGPADFLRKFDTFFEDKNYSSLQHLINEFDQRIEAIESKLRISKIPNYAYGKLRALFNKFC